MEGPNDVAGATFAGLTEDGERIYETANQKNKKIKFQIVVGNYESGYAYTISVIKPPTGN
jgi:hypothetical protein